MSDPVLITLIVCATIVVIFVIVVGIALLEKYSDKKKSDEDVDPLEGYDNRMP